MKTFSILILVALIATNSLDKAESVKLELKTFDEIFGEGWWDKDEAEDLKTPAPTNFGQNVHHQIDRQNIQIGQIEPNLTDQIGQIESYSTNQNPPLTESDHSGQIEPNSTDQLGQIERNSTDQLGQIEPNSTDQLGQIEPNSSDHSGQIEPNSTDQNPPLTESDHSGQIEPNSTDQLGQIEPNSTDQLGQIEPNSTDHSGQIEPNSTDQNPPLTESDHSGQIEPNSTDQNPPLTESDHSDNAEDERKRKIVDKFLEMRNEFKQKGKYSTKEWHQIEQKIAKHLKINRPKIYKWKKEFGLSRKMHNFGKEKNERINLIEKFDQMKAELKRAGFKNSYSNQIDKTVAKELGLSLATIYNWKSKLGQIEEPQHKYSHSEQKELMKLYYEIKDQNPKMSVGDIAKILKIGCATLYKWKKQFQPNFVDSVEENSAENVQDF